VKLLAAIAAGIMLMAGTAGAAERPPAPDGGIDLLCKKYSTIYIKNAASVKTFRAILKVESNDGEYLVGIYDPSFGISQLKIKAVKHAAEYWSIPIPVSDDKIVWRLIQDNDFSIKMGAAYYGMLLNIFKNSEIAAIAYNIGMGKVKRLQKEGHPLPTTYINKIRNRID